MSYGYVSHHLQEELSESDCPSEGQHVATDITELYRRKRQIPSRSYYPGYFEHQSRPCPCIYATEQPPRYCCYKTAAPVQDGMFRSSTHLPKSQGPPVKRYPITARTPRYYRCSTAPLCKRPSALCLPVTCQPDPAAAAAVAMAAVHRPRKPDIQQRYKGQEYDYVKKKPEVDSEGDVNSKLNDLETILTKFDDDDDDDDEDDEGGVEIGSVNDISKILKPRVPASVKAKQEKMVKLKSAGGGKVPVKRESPGRTEHANRNNEPLNVVLQHLTKKQVPDEKHEELGQSGKTAPPPPPPPPPPRMKFMEGSRVRSVAFEQKPSLDDNSAIELHKSKSYIVSLIDKALSKELGTIPGDKCTRKEFLNMSPKKAIDLVNRHGPRTYNKIVSADMAQSSSVKKESVFECRNEEPLYLKQLKQLRWSHLRHIQREAKRLADLERFLDSFGEIDSGP